jgi:hypothetical protein
VDDERNPEAFDDLFEPFSLEDAPPQASAERQPAPAPTRTETQQAGMPAATVACPSCGTPNPPSNRHCESCGARIAQGPLPVAPQPPIRTTPGARALGVLVTVVVVVALLALVVNFLRDGGDDTAAEGETTDSSVITEGTQAPVDDIPVVDIVQLTPTRAEASSELPAFPVSALIDEDPTNSWNDEGLRGVGAELRFFFAQPVQITQVVMQNVTDEERFRRNYRIEGIEVTIDDLPTSATIESLADTQEPQTVEIPSVRTTQVTIRVSSTYPAETFNDKPPFDELALQEVKFFGRVSPSS